MVRIRQIGDADEPGRTPSWIESLPIITKHWLIATVTITVLGNIGVLPVGKLIYDFTLIKEQFQLWRLLTPFLFVGGFSFPTAISLLLLYQYSSQYEKSSVYNTGAGGGTADYATMLLLGIVGVLLSIPFVEMNPFYSKNLIYYVLYVWSKRNPNSQASVWGLQVGAAMLPFAVLGLNLIMGNPWTDIAQGMAMGHVYYFLVEVVPIMYQKDIIHTPNFLIDFFGVGEYTAPPPVVTGNTSGGSVGGGGRPSGGGSGSSGGGSSGYNWGNGGRALGRD